MAMMKMTRNLTSSERSLGGKVSYAAGEGTHRAAARVRRWEAVNTSL